MNGLPATPAGRVKCPDCPDGQLWDRNGPTADACLTCGGEAFIWVADEDEDDGDTGEDTNVENSDAF